KGRRGEGAMMRRTSLPADEPAAQFKKRSQRRRLILALQISHSHLPSQIQISHLHLSQRPAANRVRDRALWQNRHSKPALYHLYYRVRSLQLHRDLWLKVALFEEQVDQPSCVPAFFPEDQRLARQLFRCDLSRPRERVIRLERRHEMIASKRFGKHIRSLNRQGHQTHVDLALQNLIHYPFA